jgi:V/A-type H+-transporting ATPase subunit I
MVIGVIHVNIGHVLAFVKGVKEGNKAVVINKIGLFIFEIFGIPFLLRAMLNVNLLPMSDSIYSLFGYIMALGLMTIVVSTFMDMGGLGAVFWIFDVTGLLGDVMSYCRLAGVGLAAMYLAESFNMLSEWIYGIISSIAPGILGLILGGIFAFFVLAFGHMLNLMLGALAAFIHSLRLCFVEFLLKFYEGGGRPYTPFRLRTWQHVVLR